MCTEFHFLFWKAETTVDCDFLLSVHDEVIEIIIQTSWSEVHAVFMEVCSLRLVDTVTLDSMSDNSQ
jgi:hypothetical protein